MFPPIGGGIQIASFLFASLFTRGRWSHMFWFGRFLHQMVFPMQSPQGFVPPPGLKHGIFGGLQIQSKNTVNIGLSHWYIKRQGTIGRHLCDVFLPFHQTTKLPSDSVSSNDYFSFWNMLCKIPAVFEAVRQAYLVCLVTIFKVAWIIFSSQSVA